MHVIKKVHNRLNFVDFDLEDTVVLRRGILE